MPLPGCSRAAARLLPAHARCTHPAGFPPRLIRGAAGTHPWPPCLAACSLASTHLAGVATDCPQLIRDVVETHPFLAMDTEFPGVVARPVGSFRNSGEYHYQTLR